jgi:hypothetical protein
MSAEDWRQIKRLELYARREQRPQLPLTPGSTVFVAAVCALGFAGCLAGLLTEPSDRWMETVYLVGLIVAGPVGASAVAVARGLRRAEVNSALGQVRSAQRRLEGLVLVRRGLRVPSSFEAFESRASGELSIAEEAIGGLESLRGNYWRLVALGAERAAAAGATVLPESTDMAHEVVGGMPPSAGSPRDVR